MSITYGNGVDQYRSTSVNTATPLELVVMLYDGAINFIDQGKNAIENRQHEKQNIALNKAQKIITELMTCLDLRKGGEIAANLFSLYNYCLNELIEANVHDKIESLERVKKVLFELRAAWNSIEDRNDIDMTPPAQRILMEG